MELARQDNGEPGLEEALSRLGELGLEPLDADQAIVAVQQAAQAISAAVAATASSGQACHLQAVLLSLSRLSKVLQALDSSLAEGDALVAADDEFWSTSVLPLVDALLFSERWELVLQQQGSLGKELVESAKCLIRDAIMPLLCSVAAKSQDAQRLMGTHSALLDLGIMAAALFEYRGGRTVDVGSRATLAPYVALNLSWHGIARLWTASSPAVRQQLQEEGMSAGHVLKMLCSFLKQDVDALAGGAQGRQNIAKRSQFWLMLVNKLALACPEVCATAWEALLKWLVYARGRLASLASAESICDVAEPELISKAAKCLVLMLNSIKCDNALKVSVDGLRARLAAGQNASDQQQNLGASTLMAAVDILECGAIMKARVRLACVELVPTVVEALAAPTHAAAALTDSALPLRVAEGVLMFMAASCSACGSSDQDWDVWLRAQRQLFQLALYPHPLVAEVLLHCWGDLIRLGDRAIAKQHIAAVHELLHAAAVAARGGNRDGAALVAQLVALLSSLLCSASGVLGEECLRDFLQVHAPVTYDVARLSCLSTDLCVAALTDAAAASRAHAPAVQAALQHLAAGLHEHCSSPESIQRMALEPPGAPEAAAFLVLIECIEHAMSYLADSGTMPMDHGMLEFLVADLALVCTTAATSAPCWAPPALRALASLSELAGDQPRLLADAQLGMLLPALEAYASQHQETAPPAAALAAAFKRSDILPTSLFHATLLEADPVLQFTALEAYVNYTKTCDGSLIMAMLPPAMLDPETGVISGEHKEVLIKHLARRPGSGELTSGKQLHACALELATAADGAAVQLAASARELAARWQALPPSTLTEAAAAPEGSEDVGRAAELAARAVCHAVQQLELVAVTAGGVFDANTLQALRECSLKLGSLVSQP